MENLCYTKIHQTLSHKFERKMKNMDNIPINGIDENFYNNIRNTILKARTNIYKNINYEMVTSSWDIGKQIIEEELKGKNRADYGKQLIKLLSQRLTKEFGKWYSETNLRNMKIFYTMFQNYQTLSDELSWSHYIELSKIKDETMRKFLYRLSIL